MAKSDLTKTSDGISLADWDAVRILATGCVNAVVDGLENEKSAALRKKMLRLLNRLSMKYGDKPSILATKADYVVSNKKRVNLLEDAFSLAEKMGDHKNMTLISSSLAEFYVEDMGDLRNGRAWLDRLANALLDYPDSMEQSVYERIKHTMSLQTTQKTLDSL